MAQIGRMITLAGIVAFGMTGSALTAEGPPKFQIDTSWPKPLPKNWIFGQIGGIFVDKDDNVWISQRPRTVNDRDKRAQRGQGEGVQADSRRHPGSERPPEVPGQVHWSDDQACPG